MVETRHQEQRRLQNEAYRYLTEPEYQRYAGHGSHYNDNDPTHRHRQQDDQPYNVVVRNYSRRKPLQNNQ